MYTDIYQNVGEVLRDGESVRVSRLFDKENHEVVFEIDIKNGEIQHFWIISESGTRIDLLSMLSSRDTILAKISNKNQFSASTNSEGRALLEWNADKVVFSTEDVLAFIHELGHAMDGTRISYEEFIQRVREAHPSTLAEAQSYKSGEESAQRNGLKIIQLLIKRKIFKNTEELATLLSTWNSDYEKRQQERLARFQTQ